MAILTKEQIIEREQRVFADAVEKKQDPAWWIAKDRAERWAEFLSDFPVRKEIAEWALAMQVKHSRVKVVDSVPVQVFDGATCRYHNNVVGWVLALLICRYGEAEYHWPVDGFTDDDVKRSNQWLLGKTPADGVVYL